VKLIYVDLDQDQKVFHSHKQLETALSAIVPDFGGTIAGDAKSQDASEVELSRGIVCRLKLERPDSSASLSDPIWFVSKRH